MSRLPALLLGLLLAWTTPVAAQPKSDPAGMGALAATLLQGRDGDWRGTIEKGGYKLENRGREAGLRYFFTDLDAATAGRRSAKVRVRVEGERPTSQAGLLYGFRPEPRSYFLYALSGDGTAVLLHRDGATVRRLWSLRDADTERRQGQLTLTERGGAIELMLGDRLVGRIEHPAIGTGGIGIVAAGLGVVRFSGFETGEAKALPLAAPPPAPTPPPTAATPPVPPGFGLGALGGGTTP